MKACPTCGAPRPERFAPWQWALAVLFFPFGLAAFAAGRRPAPCPRCRPAAAFTPDPGKRLLFGFLTCVCAFGALVTALEIPERAGPRRPGDLREVRGRLAWAAERETTARVQETVGSGRSRRTVHKDVVVETYHLLRLEGDPAEYRVPGNVACDCGPLLAPGAAGQEAVLHVAAGAGTTDVLGLRLGGSALLAPEFGLFMGNLAAFARASACGTLALLAAVCFLRFRAHAPAPAARAAGG